MLLVLSELDGKEIININDGQRLGIVADSDIVVDKNNGKIITLIMPQRKFQFKMFKENSTIEIPWAAIKKIGNDMIIVEL